MDRYNLGFFFEYEPTLKRFFVLLIQKKRTDRGRAGRLYWNGIGGKLDPDQDKDDFAGMIREFLEETGQPTHPDQWRMVATVESVGATSQDGVVKVEPWAIQVFKGIGVISAAAIGHRTREGLVQAFDVRKLPISLDDTARWLIPLCLDLSFTGFASASFLSGKHILFNKTGG